MTIERDFGGSMNYDGIWIEPTRQPEGCGSVSTSRPTKDFSRTAKHAATKRRMVRIITPQPISAVHISTLANAVAEVVTRATRSEVERVAACFLQWIH
jgi:hypothetical protein